MTDITTIASTITAAFLASFVEVVEAFTIMLAVGVTQGWRPAFIGAGLAGAVLAALVLLLGPLLSLIPVHGLQFAIGVLLIEAEAAGGEVAAPIASQVISAGYE